jgi:hypothetical protein
MSEKYIPLEDDPDSLLEVLEELCLLLLSAVSLSNTTGGYAKGGRSFPPISMSSSISSLPANTCTIINLNNNQCHTENINGEKSTVMMHGWVDESIFTFELLNRRKQ